MWCHGRRPVRHAVAPEDPDHPARDHTVSTAFSDSSIAPIRTTCSIMKLFSSSLCYACATDGAIAIKFPTNVAAWTDLCLSLFSAVAAALAAAAAAAPPLGFGFDCGCGSCKLCTRTRERETIARDFLIDLLCVFCPSLFANYCSASLLFTLHSPPFLSSSQSLATFA